MVDDIYTATEKRMMPGEGAASIKDEQPLNTTCRKAICRDPGCYTAANPAVQGSCGQRCSRVLCSNIAVRDLQPPGLMPLFLSLKKFFRAPRQRYHRQWILSSRCYVALIIVRQCRSPTSAKGTSKGPAGILTLGERSSLWLAPSSPRPRFP